MERRSVSHSHDGKMIAFHGNRWGNNDIYVIDASGSKPKRLTYHSGSDANPKWKKDGTIIFNTRRAFLQVERESEIYSVQMDGKTPQRVVDAVGLSPSPSADGKYIAFVRGNCRIAREAYVGPANRNIWTYHPKSDTYNQVTKYEGQDIKPIVADGAVYFLSARDGRYNIYRQDLNGSGAVKGSPQTLTNFTDEGITHFDVKGNTIVFERAGAIYAMSVKAGSRSNKVNIQLTEDDRFDPIEHRQLTSGISEYALSPDEKQMAFIVRGELFVKLNDKDKKRSTQLTDHPFRDKDPLWVNDSTLLFASDRGGNFDLYRLTSSSDEPSLYQRSC